MVLRWALRVCSCCAYDSWVLMWNHNPKRTWCAHNVILSKSESSNSFQFIALSYRHYLLIEISFSRSQWYNSSNNFEPEQIHSAESNLRKIEEPHKSLCFKSHLIWIVFVLKMDKSLSSHKEIETTAIKTSSHLCSRADDQFFMFFKGYLKFLESTLIWFELHFLYLSRQAFRFETTRRTIIRTHQKSIKTQFSWHKVRIAPKSVDSHKTQSYVHIVIFYDFRVFTIWVTCCIRPVEMKRDQLASYYTIINWKS